ncbi:helix-turn-helix domain-containing protein [Fulvivirga lutimaris]|uniref:helix-turn-helix domain-containing protein n=1 Tax=Fulvivirga lutimaris TaxID=1819566 RepID=UPI0012BD1F14|nr:helix-turn-helix domain-containing protein [Fulvivirga lutimaris]MTI38003.1 helix-turn-helix domain-containing protein [Fulvivirga lutimaris]
MYFKLIDIIILSGAIQGLALSGYLVHKKANKYLIWIIFMTTIMLLGRGFYFHFRKTSLPFHFVFLPDALIFLFGPVIYFYTKSILGHSNFKKLYHYIPIIIYLITVAYVCQYTSKELVQMQYDGSLTLWYSLTEFGGIISGLIYISVSFFMIRSNRGLTSKRKKFKFLNAFIILMYADVILWLVTFLYRYFVSHRLFIDYNAIWLITPLTVHIIAYYAINSVKSIAPATKGDAAQLSNDNQLSKLKEELERLMKEEHVYKELNLTLDELASKLKTTSNRLSWLLNEVYHEGFNDFVNNYRLEAFLKSIEEGAHHKLTILGLANESGFNSKATFNKVFKNRLNTTPSNYIKSREAQ